MSFSGTCPSRPNLMRFLLQDFQLMSRRLKLSITFSLFKTFSQGTIKLPVQHQHITALTFSRCGSLLTAGTIKGEIISWDVARVLVDSENEEGGNSFIVGSLRLFSVSTTATGFAKNYRYHQPYRTKRSPICFLQYSRRNVLLAAGPFSR